MAKLKLNLGDVISIPLSGDLFGFGQIVGTYDKKSGGFLVAIFDSKSTDLNGVKLSSICNSEIIFLGFTFDAKLYHKHWSIIGNYTENISAIKKPYNRLGTPPDEIYLIDANNDRVAEISEDI
ncbi:MAG: Imm26 family immunity protein, partial [Ignavibacteria bacterium]|nr:Imm26 family immunity protein [Ignavibacteria bacterium]